MIRQSKSVRASEAFEEYRSAIDAAMIELFGISTRDAGIEADLIARAQRNGDTPESFVHRFGDRYGLIPVSEG